MTLAAQLDATNINIFAANKRGKKAKKAKDVVKLKINFTIVKNITAETGERTLYVRITKPDNGVLSKSDSNTFPHENREPVYSIKKYIEYNGEEQNVTVYWDVEEFLYAGSYRRHIPRTERLSVHSRSIWIDSDDSIIRQKNKRTNLRCVKTKICSLFFCLKKDCFLFLPPLNQKIRNLFCNIIETLHLHRCLCNYCCFIKQYFHNIYNV